MSVVVMLLSLPLCPVAACKIVTLNSDLIAVCNHTVVQRYDGVTLFSVTEIIV